MPPQRSSRVLASPTRNTSGSELLQGTGVYLVADCFHASRTRPSARKERHNPRACWSNANAQVRSHLIAGRLIIEALGSFSLGFVTLRNCPSDNPRARWPPPVLSRRGRDAEFDTVSGLSSMFTRSS